MSKQAVRILVQLENLKGKEEGLSELRHYTDPFSHPPGFRNTKDINQKTNEKQSSAIKIVNKVKKQNETTVSVAMCPQHIKYSNLESHLCFDVVGTEYDHSVQNEYENISRALFRDKRDCALIEIKSQRLKCPVRELAEMLVSNVATQMLLQHLDVKNIELEYCDLRKYEAVGLLGRRKGFKSVENTVQFASILMLLKWLHTDFQRYWQSAKNNDVIDVQYTLVNSDGITQQHRISIIHLYVSKMDIWTRIELDNILRNVNVRNNSSQKRQTILSDCLREYFHKNSAWNVWICFRIPTYVHSSTNIVYDMLQMAVGVYTKTHHSTNATSIIDDLSNSAPTLTIINDFKKDTQIVNKSEAGIADAQHKKETSGIQQNMAASMHLTNNFVDRLSYWYNKIDEHAMDVMKAMKEYYILKMSSSLEKVNNNINSISLLLTKSVEKCNSPNSNVPMRTSDVKILRYLREKFTLSYDTFLKIKQQCMSSIKYNLIAAYHNTKKEQIVQEERRLLRMFVKNCHHDLCTNLRQQLQVLALTTAN